MLIRKTLAHFLNLEEMHGLIEEKKSRGHNLSIFVLSARGYGINQDNSELCVFFTLLAKNINNKNLPQHFQIAVKNGGHWFGIDCYLKNRQLYVLVIDSVGFNTSFSLVTNAISPIQSAKLFFYKGIEIQYDVDHCSFFTLDHLFRFASKKEHWKELICICDNYAAEKYFEFDEKQCPISLAFIFKNIQSFTALKKIPKSLKITPVNKKNQTLIQLIAQNTHDICLKNGKKKKVNNGIFLKEEKYMARMVEFFKSGNYKNVNSSRQGFELLQGKK